MNFQIEPYQGAGLFAANDNASPQAAVRLKSIDPRTLLSIDVALLRCLRKLETPRDRICSALLLSQAEYDYICEML